MKSVLVSLVLAALLAPLFPASAEPVGRCGGGLGIFTVPAGPAGTYYVDERGLSNSVWVYQESNTIRGLQRGGTNPIGDRDICTDVGDWVPDRLLF